MVNTARQVSWIDKSCRLLFPPLTTSCIIRPSFSGIQCLLRRCDGQAMNGMLAMSAWHFKSSPLAREIVLGRSKYNCYLGAETLTTAAWHTTRCGLLLQKYYTALTLSCVLKVKGGCSNGRSHCGRSRLW
jgi:hypothetical protein